jgi:SulP family sulfate permease
MGARSRLVGLLLAAVCAIVLLMGGSLLSFFPNPVLGGLLLFLALDFLVTWVYEAWFKLPLADYGMVILILVVIATVGFLEGVGLGVALAVILFVVDYSRINVVRHTLSGTLYQSNFEHPRLYHQLLRRKGDWIYILELQGFIFFGTANKLLEQVRQRINDSNLPTPRFVVLDFRLVNGFDSSAVLSFARMKQLAQTHKIVLVFTQLSAKMQRQLEKEILSDEDGAVWQVYPDLDRGVEWCEEQIVQTFESVGLTAKSKTFKQQLEESLPRSGRFTRLLDFLVQEDTEQTKGIETESFSMASLMTHMERKDVEAGYYLIHQGDTPQGLYFIETGQVTVQLEQKEGSTVRLRTMGAGTVVGELGLYLGTPASASVVTDQPSTIYYLSTNKLTQMEKTDPQIAAAFHKFIAQRLGERLLSANDTLRALLK